MIVLIRRKWFDLFGLFIGIGLAIVGTPFLIETARYLQELYDEHNPPSRMEISEATYLDKTTLKLRFLVTRLRDCQFLTLDGYSGSTPIDLLPATTLRREDAQKPLSYPTGVRITSPPWIMHPVYGEHLLLKGYYDCNGRVVRGAPITGKVPQ